MLLSRNASSPTIGKPERNISMGLLFMRHLLEFKYKYKNKWTSAQQFLVMPHSMPDAARFQEQMSFTALCIINLKTCIQTYKQLCYVLQHCGMKRNLTVITYLWNEMPESFDCLLRQPGTAHVVGISHADNSNNQ